MWSQYLEVAIGPDAEVFSKSPVLSTVGTGAPIGVRSDSTWNNPEPAVVLIVDPRGEIVGATLGNDVKLRDLEGDRKRRRLNCSHQFATSMPTSGVNKQQATNTTL